MIKLMNVDNFSAIKKSNDIAEIARPLSLLNIHFFNHIRVFNDGSRISLSNRGDWLEYFFKNQLYNLGNFSRNPKSLPVGHCLWKLLPRDGVLDIASNQFDIDNGITIIEKNSNYVDIYLFASNKNNEAINNFYLNHKDVFEHFIKYYNDKVRPILKKCKPDKPIFGSDHNNFIDNQLNLDNINYDNLTNFYEQTKINKYIVHHKNTDISISNREYQCVELLLKGCSVKETCNILGIKARTCYSYLNHLKNKFNCVTRCQLLQTLKKLVT